MSRKTNNIILIVILFLYFINFFNGFEIFEAQGMKEKTGEKILLSNKLISEKSIVDKLRKSSDLELKNLGYKESDIKRIRQANLHDTLSYGDLSYSLYYDKKDFHYDAKKNITYLKTTLYWRWEKAPFFKFTDVVSVGNGDGFDVDSAKAFVNYYRSGDRKLEKKKKEIKLNTRKFSPVFFVRVPLTSSYNGVNDFEALDGKLTVTWKKEGNVSLLGVGANYGHAVLGFTLDTRESSGDPFVSNNHFSKIVSFDEAYILVERK